MKRSYPHERKQKSLAAGAKKIGFTWFFYIFPHAYTKQKIGATSVPVAPIDRGRPQTSRAAAIMVIANDYSVAPTLTISTLKIKVEYGGMLPVPFLP